MVPAKHTEESEVRELSGKESGTGFGTPFPCKYYTKPLKKGVPELILDSFSESSPPKTSVWFAGTTPELRPILRRSGLTSESSSQP